LSAARPGRFAQTSVHATALDSDGVVPALSLPSRAPPCVRTALAAPSIGRRPALALAAAFGGWSAAHALVPLPADDAELSSSIKMIARVIEATRIESAMVSSGRYPDPNRKSVGKAAERMLTNFQLQRSLVRAAASAPPESAAGAVQHSQEAVEYLSQLAEYSPGIPLDIGSLNADQLALVLDSFAGARKSLEAFLKLISREAVSATLAQMRAEDSREGQGHRQRTSSRTSTGAERELEGCSVTIVLCTRLEGCSGTT
jgi:hypothetical protein